MGKRSVFENKILIVDDNLELRKLLRLFLTKEGYTKIETAADCGSAEQRIMEGQPDFIILDVNLPDGDGFSLMKRIKENQESRGIPVLFLSARDQDQDRLRGLGLGADDYMVKPFLPKELLLRMAAILKRSYSYESSAAAAQHRMDETEGAGVSLSDSAAERVQRTDAPNAETACKDGVGDRFGAETLRRAGENSGTMRAAAGNDIELRDGFVCQGKTKTQYEIQPQAEFAGAAQHHLLSLGSHLIDFDAATVTCRGETDTLTAKELKILETLEESRGKIVTFDNLCAAVWNARYYTYENTVMVHMRRLREKVEDDPSRPKWIVTARGIGYKLNLKPAEPKKKQ